jgi:hypothetical protein
MIFGQNPASERSCSKIDHRRRHHRCTAKIVLPTRATSNLFAARYSDRLLATIQGTEVAE